MIELFKNRILKRLITNPLFVSLIVEVVLAVMDREIDNNEKICIRAKVEALIRDMLRRL